MAPRDSLILSQINALRTNIDTIVKQFQSIGSSNYKLKMVLQLQMVPQFGHYQHTLIESQTQIAGRRLGIVGTPPGLFYFVFFFHRPTGVTLFEKGENYRDTRPRPKRNYETINICKI